MTHLFDMRTATIVFGAALALSGCDMLTTALTPTAQPQQSAQPFKPDLSLKTPGLDVSHFQGTDISWSDLKTEGIAFVMIKASQGVSSPDPEFTNHVAGADSVDIPTGAYHFFQLGDPGVAQADFFLKTIAGQSLELPPVLDLEGAPSEAGFKAALDWMTHVKTQTGCQPVLYIDEANYRVMAPMLDATQPIWLAAYTPTLPGTGLPPNIWYWQHTSQADYTGVSGNVDSDWFFGTATDLATLGCAGTG
ncbi:glycoside hydrolase family 25 protein [uncultured Tateyamaria sp.]|uniref:glycoside hydrolase family 25 protein n=1 Tax=uncultured Tateyamaria sp. TaxID=455651 RepID=UPI0026349BFC|nr:glycoside hydrolase family 25 protein [uncultured Tateyamaria sp.]